MSLSRSPRSRVCGWRSAPWHVAAGGDSGHRGAGRSPGRKLLNRTTRFVRATDAGARYLESARRILAEADEADEAAAGVPPSAWTTRRDRASFVRKPVHPPGHRRLPEPIPRRLRVRIVSRPCRQPAGGRPRCRRTNRRTARFDDAGNSGWFVRRVVCASPRYLKKHGEPREPGELARHTIVAASPVSPSIEWRFGVGKQSITTKVRPRLSATSNDAAIHAALLDFGVTRLMSYQVAAYLAAGRLKRVLAAYEPPPLPIHVMHLEGRQGRRRCAALSTCWSSDCGRRLRSPKAGSAANYMAYTGRDPTPSGYWFV